MFIFHGHQLLPKALAIFTPSIYIDILHLYIYTYIYIYTWSKLSYSIYYSVVSLSSSMSVSQLIIFVQD